ncbi:two component transcriptional regulator, winged helix family [Emticicia oligotrophica DSM 17448]|uniref:Two component transcriptional regulator, winged helix family n=1 Tax=Emticicia oligotrophica (strain DSM 17448 / CIP 109782 / MTCC 6937 / GPTSA100-15) TaxID=929562 RepID=A0ABM5MXS1_EMTOG|nr:response regulator transcription factor [Emticicia oligotrophica]AFK01936.1 two component transcriptional regulator, winged helix family [Emticicia oligotrophica DSM 17448]
MMENKKILIVEDEVKVATFIKKGLQTQNFEAEVAETGSDAKQLFETENFDLIILDIGLPDMSGLDFCEFVRAKNTKIPVLMLTALGSVADKLSGFEVGTDDYMVKPFDFMELLVRVKALLKRTTEVEQPAEKLQEADLELDLKEKVARRDGKVVELTAKEFSLLEYLMLNKGRVVSKVDIAEKVWDINFDTGTNFIEVYVNYLRNKIDKGFSNKLIHTIVGMGYMLKNK